MKFSNFTNFSKFKHKETKVKPFIEFPSLGTAEKTAKKTKFKIRDLDAYKLANGIICVTLNWNANESAQGGFKMGVLGCKTYDYDAVSLEIMFPEIKYHWYNKKEKNTGEYGINCGIQTVDGSRIKYEPLYFQNLKYGASIYFGPKGWNYYKKAQKLFNYDSTKEN